MNKIKRLLVLVEKYKLDVSYAVLSIPLEEMENEYNGAGPDWLPASLRYILTWLLDRFEPAFLIHDMEFKDSDCTKEAFNKSNSRLLVNCKKIVITDFSWWHPRRYSMLYKCKKIYKICQDYGFSAWCDGAKS